MTKNEKRCWKEVHEKIHEKAIRLAETGFVNVDGLLVRVIKTPVDISSCDICEMDSVCTKEGWRILAFICKEVDMLKNCEHYLDIVSD